MRRCWAHGLALPDLKTLDDEQLARFIAIDAAECVVHVDDVEVTA